jgi:hypothetical protein
MSDLPYGGSGLPYGGEKEPYTPRKKRKDDGGAVAYDGPTLPIPTRLPTWDDAKHAVDVAKSFLTPADPYEAAGKMVNQARGGDYLGALETGVSTMPGVGIVPVEHALASGVPKALPKDELFERAVANTAGAAIDDGALILPVARRQLPAQHGDVSLRGGVFYLPQGDKRLTYYNGTQGYGGQDKIAGTTALLNPLFVKGATGGKAPEAAFAALKGKDAMKQLDRDVFSAVNEKHWMQKQDPSIYSERIGNLLSDYGADPWLADYIIEHSNKGNQLRYALQENIIGNAVRNAGHDAVLGYSMGKGRNPFLSELFDVRESHYPTPQGGYEVFDQFMPKAEGGAVEPSAALTGPHTITADDLIGRAISTAQNLGAYTDAGGQKIAAPYVTGMKDGYPVYAPQTAISDALDVASSILPKHGMNTGTPVYSLAGV